ncbi:MAG: LuxR C-terminal-related transcriptional regulator [Candidatus Margulisiibacteriota bacterium]
MLGNEYLNKSNRKTQKLSKREHEVYILMGEGLTQTEIAKKLFINKKTVSTFRRRILDKLKLSSTNQLIHYYLTEKHNEAR